MLHVELQLLYVLGNHWSIAVNIITLFLFVVSVKSENASSLHTTLQDIAESKAVLETFDIKFTSRKVKVDLRLKNNSGRPEIVVVKKNEQKVVVCDILCLHR